MKKTYLLSTAAAFLIISIGAASAQMKEQAPPERAPAAQQNAPAEKIAPPLNANPKPTETSGQSAPTPQQPGVNDSVKPGGAMNAPSGKDSSDMKGSPDSKSGADIKARSDANSAPNKAAADKASQDRATTGQGAAGAAKLSTEQRTKVTTVFKQKKVEPAKLTVSINIGTRVPSTVRFYPVPQDVIVIYPEWRGYDYILVGNQVLILEPDTHEIVAILDA